MPARRRPSESSSQSEAAPASRRPERVARHLHQVERGERDGDRLAALPEHQHPGRECHGRRCDHQRETSRAAGEQERDAQPEQQVRAQEHLEERDRDRLERREGQVAAAPGLLEARERDEGAHDQAERGHDRIRVDEREQQVAAQQVAPPVRLRVRREHEREVGQQQRPGNEGDGERGSAEAGRERAYREDQAEAPESDIESRDRVPGVGAGPAPGCRPHEIRPEVVANRETRDSRYLRRLAGQDLVGEADVEGRVEGDERVEQKVAGSRLHPVPGVVRRSQEGDESEGGRDRTSQRRAGGALTGAAPEPPRPREQEHDGRGKERREARDEADPEGERAEGRAQRHRQRRVYRGSREPLEREPWQQDEGGREE